MTPEDTGLLLQAMREDMRHRFDRLEDKVDKKVDVERVIAIEREIKDLRGATLTSDSVGTMIGKALQDSSARGWSSKERAMYVIGFVFLCVNFVLGIAALGPDLFGGGTG